MKTIVGSITIQAGKELPQKFLDVATIKLPFEAVSWESTKIPTVKVFDSKGVEFLKGKEVKK